MWDPAPYPKVRVISCRNRQTSIQSAEQWSQWACLKPSLPWLRKTWRNWFRQICMDKRTFVEIQLSWGEIQHAVGGKVKNKIKWKWCGEEDKRNFSSTTPLPGWLTRKVVCECPPLLGCNWKNPLLSSRAQSTEVGPPWLEAGRRSGKRQIKI